MRKLPVILGLALLLGILLFPACEVENCPPNTISYAHFTLVDQMGKQFNSSDTITVIGETVADVTVYDTLPDGSLKPRVVYDSLISEILINKEAGASSFKVPLSYNDQTRFIFSYRSLKRKFAGTDTVTVHHRNTPYFTNLDCGSMMFYEITEVKATHHRMDSLLITNPSIDNYEKENFKIYFTVAATGM